MVSEEKPQQVKLPRNVVALGAVSLLMDASTEMVRPVFPLLLRMMGAPPWVIGLIEGVAESVSSLLKLGAGWLSDKLGKRKALIVFGYGASAIAKPLIALAATPWQVLWIWLFDRTGKGVRGAPRDAIIADSTPQEIRGRAFGLHRAMDTAGAAIGPLLAMGMLWLAPRVGWTKGLDRLHSVFWLAAVPGILSVVVALAFVREKAAPPKVDGAEHERPVTNGRFIALMAVLGVFTLGNSADAFIFLRSSDLGMAVALIPGLYLVMNVVTASMSHWFGSLSDRVGRRPLVAGGFLVYAVTYAGLALVGHRALLWPLFGFYGIYYAMTDGTSRALVSDIVPAHARATAYGIYQSITGFVLLPASLLMGWLYGKIGGHAFFLGSAMALVAAVGILVVVPPRQAPTGVAGNGQKCEG